MSDFIILTLIVILVICLIGTVVGFILYSGLFSEVVVKTGTPPIRNVIIAYKFKEGPYKDCNAVYTESCSIGPKLNSIGLFYDDPNQRPVEQCRYAVGSILSEGEEQPDEDLQKLYEKFGFKVFSMPEVTHAVTTSFPSTTPLSHLLGPFRVWPELSAYIQERKLSALPTIEISKADLIHYMCPLSRQTDFFVPEMREETTQETREEDSDEDRGTDITGADSHSDVSSASGGLPWDSRETSLAASTAASLAAALPLRDQGDGGEDSPPREQRRHRGSDASLGSGSSFEELDMELVEGKGVEEEEGQGEVQDEEEEKSQVQEGATGGSQEHMTHEREAQGDGEEYVS
ncbi:testis-expressed protein 264 [Aplochiton taeniatus]